MQDRRSEWRPCVGVPVFDPSGPEPRTRVPQRSDCRRLLDVTQHAWEKTVISVLQVRGLPGERGLVVVSCLQAIAPIARAAAVVGDRENFNRLTTQSVDHAVTEMFEVTTPEKPAQRRPRHGWVPDTSQIGRAHV